MSLKDFQKATVNWALRRLQDPGSSRRILVADEVGLGKTLIAQGIISGLCEPGKHLNVFYVCSSLSIGHQNRESLLEILPEDVRAAARVEVDRLTLLPKTKPSRTSPFTLFTLTPGTMPLHGYTGRVDERAVLALLIKELFQLRSNAKLLSFLQHKVSNKSWQRALDTANKALPDIPGTLLNALRSALARQLGLANSARKLTIKNTLEDRFDGDSLEPIRNMRVALSMAALESLAPDVIVFDEFQKFFEFITQDDEDLDKTAQSLLRRLLRTDEAHITHQPAVILLSATPFRMYGTAKTGEHGAHHQDLFKLLRFLFGSESESVVTKLERDFAEYGRLLRVSAVGDVSVFSVRDRIEKTLSKVMARTERSNISMQAVRSIPEVVLTPLKPLDIRVFRHMCDSSRPQHRFMAPAYWTSIPYPMQTMERSGYIFRSSAEDIPIHRVARSIAIQKSHIRNYQELAHPHPRLRQLLRDVPPTLLSLPWLPPTLPWWNLDGPFALAKKVGTEQLSKTLIFSRFLAVPRAIASVLSYEAELAAFGKAAQGRGARNFDYMARGSSHDKRDGAMRIIGEHQPRPAFQPGSIKNIDSAITPVLDFIPFPALASIGDPLSFLQQGGQQNTMEMALTSIESHLAKLLGRSDSKKRSHPVWHWVRQLEVKAPTWTALVDGLQQWLDGASESNGTMRQVIVSFVQSTESPNTPPNEKELRELAELALLGPANVLYRTVERVFGPVNGGATRISRCTAVSYDCLRGYLDTPEFHLLLSKGKSHRSGVLRAVWDGNLESVFDEYLNTLRGLGERESPDGRESRAFDSLETSLGIRTSSIELNELGKSGKFKLRCHAAMPFGLSKTDVLSNSAGRLRNDFLRISFNSPFRPFVLASTSIGQEGLDFHVYCRQIVHWDLPSKPVDLEQRDGRVSRFGGLAIRHVLADTPVNYRVGHSPWNEIGLAQIEKDGGLSPWWGCNGGDIRRLVYVPHFSRQHEELDRLLEELSLYRMTIGQADQEQLVRALKRRLETSDSERERIQEWLRNCRIQLSPYFRSKD